jgi:hypothetical protein
MESEEEEVALKIEFIIVRRLVPKNANASGAVYTVCGYHHLLGNKK